MHHPVPTLRTQHLVLRRHIDLAQSRERSVSGVLSHL